MLTVSQGTLAALRLLDQSGRTMHGNRLLDRAYGPHARTLRAKCAELVTGTPVSKSAKIVQWGEWRRLMLAQLEITGEAIVVEDHEFERVARELLAGCQ